MTKVSDLVKSAGVLFFVSLSFPLPLLLFFAVNGWIAVDNVNWRPFGGENVRPKLNNKEEIKRREVEAETTSRLREN